MGIRGDPFADVDYGQTDDDYDGHAAENCYDCNGSGEWDEYVPYMEGGAYLTIVCPCPCHLDLSA